MNTTSIGEQAETAVAALFSEKGYKILARNWKTKFCEIDIVAEKDRIVYFVEVKYRSAFAQGSGLEYIGPQKLRRLKFAAEVWCQNQKWDGDYQILGAEASSNGRSFGISRIVELV